MAVPGLMYSHSMRRKFIVISICLIIVLFIAAIGVYSAYIDKKNLPISEAIFSVIVSLLTSAVFAVFCAIYVTYGFIDPEHLNSSVILAPSDIRKALKETASQASEYFIFVRTGRYFRKEIAPLLGNASVENRSELSIDVILLDFRDKEICKKYADYRKQSRFDDNIDWNLAYVQAEVIATIMKLSQLSKKYTSLVINIYLTSRLSTFRIEGSADSILVTREDPKDIAHRYIRKFESARYFAFRQEFNWTKLSSCHFYTCQNSKEFEISEFINEKLKDIPSEIIDRAKEILRN